MGDRGERQIIKEKAILNHKIYSTFDGKRSSKNLTGLCLDLLSEQKETWQDLREGYDLLKEVRDRDIACNGFSVRLQYNPARMKSSTADVREGEVKGRRCFLCLDHLPEGQKGVLHRNKYLILCNPMPVFSSHLTVCHIDHRSQTIFGNLDTFLQLTADFGSGWALLYNGPKCGASAPDHLHFQAVPSGKMPIEKEMQQEKRLTLITKVGGVSLYRIPDMGREVLSLEGNNQMALENLFKFVLKSLKNVLHIDEEPMMNVAGSYSQKKWRVVIFPRQKHRPDIFYKEGDERVVVSPGVIDMGGVLITPAAKDFERLDARTIESIYREVSLEGKIVDRAVTAMMK